MRWIISCVALSVLSACQDSPKKPPLNGNLSAGTLEAKHVADSEFQKILSQITGSTSREDLLQIIYRGQLNLSALFAANFSDDTEIGRCMLLSQAPLNLQSHYEDLSYNSTYTVAYSQDNLLAADCDSYFKQSLSASNDPRPDLMKVSFFSYSF